MRPLLFDFGYDSCVQVRISVKLSRAHAQSLSYELVSGRPHLPSQVTEHGCGLRTDIVQVRKSLKRREGNWINRVGSKIALENEEGWIFQSLQSLPL